MLVYERRKTSKIAAKFSKTSNPWNAFLTAVLLLGVSLLACANEEDDLTRYVLADELRDHSGSCFDASRCSLREVGERWTVREDCETATCHRADNGTLYERRTRCATVDNIPSNDCYIVRVVGKPFPDCCPRLFCNDTLVTPRTSLA